MIRRLLFLFLLAASLLPSPGQAQDAGGGQDRLSLEALTAPQPGDGRGGGYRRRSYGGYHRSAYRPRSDGYRSYRHRSYGYRSYAHRSYGRGRTYYARRSTRSYRSARYARYSPRASDRGDRGSPYTPSFYRR